MKAKTSSPPRTAIKHLGTLLFATYSLLSLTSCLEDEGQIRELRQLREKLVQAEKQVTEAVRAAEEAQALAAAAPAPASPAPQETASAEIKTQLDAAEARNTALQKEIAQLKSTLNNPTEPATASGGADEFKDFVKSIERDLMNQASTLQQQLQETAPSVVIEGITVKRISSGFSSEIVFNVANTSGQTRPYSFPVAAMLDGKWRIPTVADVQAHLTSTAPPAPPAVAPVSTPTPQVTQAPAPTPTPTAPAPANPMGAQETVVIRWDNAPPNQPAPTPAPAPTQPQTAATTPSAPAVRPTPPPAAPAAPRIPAPVMPVTQDVQIRFE